MLYFTKHYPVHVKGTNLYVYRIISVYTNWVQYFNVEKNNMFRYLWLSPSIKEKYSNYYWVHSYYWVTKNMLIEFTLKVKVKYINCLCRFFLFNCILHFNSFCWNRNTLTVNHWNSTLTEPRKKWYQNWRKRI